MSKCIGLVFLLCGVLSASGQIMSALQTVNGYSVEQKRLLALSTAQFINFLTQDNLDQDSVTNMGCQIAGMPFLLPYNENFPGKSISVVSHLVNENRLAEAKLALKEAPPRMRIQGFVEIFLWYLHRDGKHNADLDSASIYIKRAIALSSNPPFLNWSNECLFQLAELTCQRESKESGKRLFEHLTIKSQQEGDLESSARAYKRMADMLPPTDSIKERLYYKSLDIFRRLNLNEKQVELLWKIAACHGQRDFSLMEKDLLEILVLQKLTGFQHSLFAQNILSYTLHSRENYLGALDYARAALGNMNWSGLTAVQAAMFIRIGVAYHSLGKNAEQLEWFNKALLTARKETHLFWYKSLLFLTETIGIDNKNPRHAISLLDSVTAKFPPVTLWEQMQILSDFGVYYELLNQRHEADKYYTQLLKLADSNPMADPYGEMTETFLSIARFYISMNNIKKARLFLKLGVSKDIMLTTNLYNKYWLYYKIDSLNGNFKAALQNHIKYKFYYDSAVGIGQRQRLDELTIQYAAAKKDQDIKLLKQQGFAQQSELKQNRLTRNIMIAGTTLLLIIVGLLFSRYRLKQRTNTTINRKNQALQRLLDEKEWLLKEVHHRVKNNLHTIISLLESQAAYLENDALKAIENSQHRIYAMSLIHQKLYQAETVKTIDMSLYLPEFIRYLDESFETYSRIQFSLDIEVINLGISQAIPVALIINEAVTNSIKYAFPNNSKGQIKITMNRKAGLITLVVADNGTGIDESLLNAPTKSLGLKLIKGLSSDINATIGFKNDNGTRITIVFNVDPFHNNTNPVRINERKYA